MADAYTTAFFSTSTEWAASNDGAAAGKLVAAGVYKENGKNVFWNIIAA